MGLLGVASPRLEPPLRYLYVGVPGSDLDTRNSGVSLLVFDIGHEHRFVKRISIWPAEATFEKVRGMELAPAAPSRLYISTTQRLGALDSASGRVLWSHAYGGHCCDQFAVSPNGRLIYAPAFGSPNWYVIDAVTGTLTSTTPVIGWPRSTAFSRDGRLVYLSAWESNRLSVADTTSNQVTREVGPFSGFLCTFTLNRNGTLAFANIDGLVGFEVGDLKTGLILDRVRIDGYGADDLNAYECPSHGIAFTVDDKELWVADGVGNRLRIFDATTYPPREKSSVQLKGQPRAVRFGRDGRFAYVSTGDVLDATTKAVVATLKDDRGTTVESERMIEVDVPSSTPAVGDRR